MIQMPNPIHFMRRQTDNFKPLLQPAAITKVLTCLPAKTHSLAIEQLTNRLILPHLDLEDWQFLENRQTQICISDSSLFVVLSFHDEKFSCCYFGDQEQPADVTLSINSFNAIAVIKQDIDPDTLFFQRKLKIQGDTALAHQLKNTLDNLPLNFIPDFMIRALTLYQSKILAN